MQQYYRSLNGITAPPQDHCGHCGAALDLGQRYEIHLSDGILAYSGCEACLRDRLLGAGAIPFPVAHALRRARRVITQPTDRHEIDQVVAAIDAALKG